MLKFKETLVNSLKDMCSWITLKKKWIYNRWRLHTEEHEKKGIELTSYIANEAQENYVPRK